MTQITLSELPEIVQNLINQAQKTGEPLTSPIKKKSLLETLSTLEPLDEGLLPLDDIKFEK